jgi:hypothetical protein
VPPGSNGTGILTDNGSLTCAAGSVDSASTTQLIDGFTNAYFYTGTDGAMVFWAPINGATTSGTTGIRAPNCAKRSPGDTSVSTGSPTAHIF